MEDGKKIQGASMCWKSLLHGYDLLRKCLEWQVNDSARTRFWTHIWLGKRPLQEVALQPLSMQLLSLKVCHYWDEAAGWKWTELEGLFPPQVLGLL